MMGTLLPSYSVATPTATQVLGHEIADRLAEIGGPDTVQKLSQVAGRPLAAIALPVSKS
jgi:hypothetical protein